jgi:predicted dehydrogenase
MAGFKETSTMRIGILGCANIAKQFARDVAPSRKVKIIAAASRTLDNATAFAKQFGIKQAYGDYESLLADENIDAIYLPLPNSMHAEWAIKAAQAGKHILCEKPLALGLAQAQSMFDAARAHGVMLLEAYPYYFQPQTGDMLKVLRSGRIGELRSVQASFGFTLARPDGNIRMNPDLGGGALLDAGSYPLSLIRLVMGGAPHSVRADSRWADTGVDISTTATLFFADGRTAQLSCAMNTANFRYATIVGSAGTLETEYLNHTTAVAGDNALGYLPSSMRLRAGIANSVPFEKISSPSGSGFRFAAEAFAKVVKARDFAAMDRAAQASLDIAATLEALARSAKSGRTETVDGR